MDVEGGVKNGSPKQQQERKGSYFQRNFYIMGVLAVLVFLFLVMADETVFEMTANTKDAPVGVQSWGGNPHANSFGGINNVAHPGGAKAAAAGQGIAFEDIKIPVSNFGVAAASLNPENIINLIGHYRHDEHRSPYASHLYDKPKEVLDAEQAKYIEHMEDIRQTWGAWSFQDDKAGERPVADFTQVQYGDLPNEQLPPGSWQTDEEYVSRFLKEANALVDRVTEGIYAEYGFPLKKSDGSQLTADEIEERKKVWGPIVTPRVERQQPAGPIGVAELSQAAMDGLVRKLLHALITNDEFYFVLGGHSAAAGHGNHFQQNKAITFHHLMEPVMDKLGVRLMSRNMGMGGVGTLQFSLAGKDLYGEADLMEWDSAMTEKGDTVDLWMKQAILSGERVPVILAPRGFHFNIVDETNGTAMMAELGDSAMIPETTDENADQLTYAARWLHEKNRDEKYNAICWEPRSDFTPDQPQDGHPGSQVGWHPGFRQHQFQGRKVALVLLKGLKDALQLWEKAISEDGFPLAEKYWHVGETYETIREAFRTHIKSDIANGKDVLSACERAFPETPIVCRVSMHGYGMWEPHVSENNNFLNLIHPAPNGYKPKFTKQNVYSGFDLLPYKQKIPDGEIDVHAIAIATTFPPPELNHEWEENEEDAPTNVTSAEGADRRMAVTEKPSRKWLREASEKAFRHKPKIQYVGAVERVNEVPNKLHETRKLDEESIVPGRGWYTHGWKEVDSMCDGSPMAECEREANSKCLMYGANDNHKEVAGNSLSGWLVFTVPKVKEGVILVRMEWWCGLGDALTKDRTEVNNGMTLDETPYNDTSRHLWMEDHHRFGDGTDYMPGRKLLGPDDRVPQDFKMDVAINGKLHKTWEREEWLKYAGEASKNCAVWPIFVDESMAMRDWKEGDEGEPVEVAIRFRIESEPQRGYCISHVYYA